MLIAVCIIMFIAIIAACNVYYIVIKSLLQCL